jgi:hypothetical protein
MNILILFTAMPYSLPIRLVALGERRALAIGEGRVGERGECMAPMGGGLRPIFGVVVGR